MTTIERIFRTSADGVCGIDQDRRIVFWNAAAKRLLGYDPHEVRGRFCFEVFQGLNESKRAACCYGCPKHAEAKCGREVATRDIQIRTKQGARNWVSVSTLSMPLPQLEIVLVHLFRDVDRQKSQEEAIAQLIRSATNQAPNCQAVESLSPSVPATGSQLLTRREKAVLGVLTSGASNNSIAKSLFISPSTVRNHIHNILGKLGVRNRTEAASLAIKDGLFPHDGASSPAD